MQCHMQVLCLFLNPEVALQGGCWPLHWYLPRQPAPQATTPNRPTPPPPPSFMAGCGRPPRRRPRRLRGIPWTSAASTATEAEEIAKHCEAESGPLSGPGLALKLIKRSRRRRRFGRFGFGSLSVTSAQSHSPQRFGQAPPFPASRSASTCVRSAQALALTPKSPLKHRALADELFPAIFRRRTTAERADSGRQPLSCHQSWQQNLL